MPSVDNMPIDFTSSKMRIITKAGDQAQRFAEGTKFKLFAVQASSGSHNWSNTVMYDRAGTESSGSINYGTKVSYGVAPLNVLDFYGITYGEGSDIQSVGSEGEVPKVSVSMASGTLPDLMYSDNLKAKTSSSGLLNMEFRHAMSKINIEILKQDESQDEIKQLEGAKVDKIVLKGTGTSGDFNVETGLWESVSSPSDGYVVYEGSTSVSSEVQMIVSDLHVIPVAGGNVTLDIYLSGITNAVSPVSYTLTIDAASDGKYLHLEQNHEYTFSVVVLKNDVRVVTVTPKVYDWIDVDMGNVAYFGQPVFFGGLMWMDRNLGAKSADCENDWYNTVGHYYQFGRNIPFILDVEKWLAYTEDDGTKDLKEARILEENTDRITRLHTAWSSYDDARKADVLKNMVECIYSLDHKGKRTHGYKKVSTADDILARKVGEVILDSKGNVDDDKTSASYLYGGGPGGTYQMVWTFKGNHAQDYWKSSQDQPCPRGWRLPTVDDLYTFMPRQQVNWNTSGNTYPKLIKSNQEHIRYGYVESSEGRYNVCYILKNPGTANAYRILIKSHFAKNVDGNGYSKNKRYITIARFSASKDDKIEDYTSAGYNDFLKPDSNENTMWNNPVETTSFPGCGYIVPDNHKIDLRSFGWGTIMRTSDYYSTQNNWVQYLSVTDYQLSVQSASRRSLGDQIRCVRDVNAN